MRKRVSFDFFHKFFKKEFGKGDGGTAHGHRWFSFMLDLKKQMEARGIDLLSVNELSMDDADAIVFVDLDEAMVKDFHKYKNHKPCFMVSLESPLFSPWSHDREVMADLGWKTIMTWNKTLSGSNIIHISMPSNTEGFTEKLPQRTYTEGGKGVVVKSCYFDAYGNKPKEIAFFMMLAKANLIDIYGQHWPYDPECNMYGATPNKLKTMFRYDYAFITENCLVPGFTTEKIGDAILAGLPSIYYGDSQTASERFDGCFVSLKDLTIDDYLAAREELYASYPKMIQNVHQTFKNRGTWNDSFFKAFHHAMDLSG